MSTTREEIEDPELAAKRMREIYKQKGYSDSWIEKRMRGIAESGEWAVSFDPWSLVIMLIVMFIIDGFHRWMLSRAGDQRSRRFV